MIIFSNANNPATLKLLICAKKVNKNVEMQQVKAKDQCIPSPKQLPVLQVTPDVYLFSSNAACIFLLEETLSISSTWLEWEATRLLPSIACLSGPKSVSTEANTKLKNLLGHLNKQLEKSDYIKGKCITSADISIWCTLYPIIHNDKYNKQFFSDNTHVESILKWHKGISDLSYVKECVKEYPLQPSDLCDVFTSMSVSGTHSLYNTTPVATQPLDSNNGSPSASPDVKPEIAVTEEEIKEAEEYWKNGKKMLKAPLPDEKIILPKEGHKNILITSALPYVNNVPHLGNIIGCVLSADVFARYCRLCNYNALYICGTDEYGTATETKALEEGLTPRQICDKYFEIHNSVYRWFGIGFDCFGRTTTPEQTEIVQKMFLQLHKNGFVETQTVEQLLCEGCNRFLADRFVEGTCPHPGCGYEDARGDQCDGCGKLINATELIKPRCKLCNKPPVKKESSHFFLDLPQLEPLLSTWVSGSESGWSNSAQQITRAWLKTGLKPRCITRDLSWGVPVPVEGFKNKVFYVWFDAPIGYISITKRYTEHYEQWWRPDPKHNVALYQFMAKDNVPFHSVVFPASLLGIGQKNVMVKHIMATEYLNYEDGKFSKSRGVGVFGTDAQDTGIPADVFRFYLLSIRPESQDSNFCWTDLATRNNSELLNNLGNFANRAGVFCANSFSGTIPAITLDEEDLKLLALINREIKGYVENMEGCKLREALRQVLNISRLGNQYMQAQKPWVLLKGTDDSKTRAGSVVGLSCNLSCLLGVLLHPFMPTMSRTLLAQLGTKLDAVGRINSECPGFYQPLPTGHKIGTPAPLFQKLEDSKIEELKKRYAGRQSTPPRDVSTAGMTTQDLEKAVGEQGEKVRKLKGSGVEKAVWQPEVNVLLELKKKLAEAQRKQSTGDSKSGKVAEQKGGAAENIADIEAEIAKQGEKVRNLKSAGGEKSVWQPEVDILLALKKKLVQAQQLMGISVTTDSKDSKKKSSKKK